MQPTSAAPTPPAQTADAADAAAAAPPPSFVDIEWAGRPQRIEYRWVGGADPAAPLVVLLHEGLGSQSMWKDFPQRLCAAAGMRALVFSRPGYGRSSLPADKQTWGVDYMHRQAWELLPALLDALGVDGHAPPPWLLGHSDGASIALLFAARFPARVAGLVVLAPHIMVEPISVASIEQARAAFAETDMRQRMAKYHDDVDGVFWRWNRIWLHPEFRRWTIESELAALRAPVLAVQGLDDEYGTLEQIRGIARRVPGTELLELAECRHSAHRDQPEALIAAVADFVGRHRGAAAATMAR